MRIDLHTHTLLSDGELLPIELARRALAKGHDGIAFTDHVSLSTIERVIKEASRDCELAKEWNIEAILGVEITHVPVSKIDLVVAEARRLGAELVVVHGETISEPVEKGTNRAAVNNPEVDVLAHPGFITLDEVQAAKDNNIVLEITSRAAHSATNGHVVRLAREVGARMVVNTDTHAPGDLMSEDEAIVRGLAAGLSKAEAERAVRKTPLDVMRRIRKR
ncbi:MAG: histidinol phosphate phosphatase domain-containing protein [Methanomassiliicoccales archaeon]|nr:histidinol phosphate phosphatase domain-containing protein [Methanomassiliicoccales archaeon]